VTDLDPRTERLRVSIRGAVQGVGFRPFVYRLAEALSLPGWVINSAAGVVVEVEGPPETLRRFLVRLDRERPPRAVVQGLEPCWLDPVGFERFEIRHSEDGDKRTLILPDIAPCDDCLRELRDPADRRFRYPFTNCTNCGPRFTIIEGLPYDRPRTTMKRFRMCAACQGEYDDPRDRRFHAQPNACPACGPRLQLWAGDGRRLDEGDDALRFAARAISQGLIVAVKGVGGFHLVVDARHEAAVGRLREAKGREEKPFAVMVPDIDSARHECEVGPLEARLLGSPEAPIVLMDRRAGGTVAAGAAPRNPTLGLMLPSTPLHHLLLAELSHPVIATSGNRADEPICTDEHEALTRLAGLADLYLVHDRPIARHVDDSIVRVVLGRELIMRRARGYAPLPITLRSPGGDDTPGDAVPSVLGVGAHLKNTVALSVGRNLFVSQHIGDLETPQASRAFECVIADFERMYEISPARVACDLHPDYLSTVFARAAGPPLVAVQHHVAHVLSCMAENEQGLPLLGVAWDGTGYGADGRIWGGEWFEVAEGRVRRVASLSPFGLPGGDAAVRDPRRAAAALLFALRGADAFALDDLAPMAALSPADRRTLRQMLERGVNTPLTSSAGRLFDGVASLLNLRHRVSYEGQAAAELEWAASRGRPGTSYPFVIHDEVAEAGERDSPALVDWGPMLEALVDDLRAGAEPSDLARRFHDTLVEMIVAVASRQRLERVALSGGCFQNRYLTERAVVRLREAGFRPFWHQRVPPNDGGIALGQVVAAIWQIRNVEGRMENVEGRMENADGRMKNVEGGTG
jgi:hydrogenase maturation protein HypF